MTVSLVKWFFRTCIEDLVASRASHGFLLALIVGPRYNDLQRGQPGGLRRTVDHHARHMEPRKWPT